MVQLQFYFLLLISSSGKQFLLSTEPYSAKSKHKRQWNPAPKRAAVEDKHGATEQTKLAQSISDF